MSTTLNASTSSGLVQSADTSGTLELQSNGTTQLTVASTGAYGTLKSGTTVASTSGTSIDFTSIPSWVKRVTVMFQGVSTTGTSWLVQIGAGSIETTGYNSSGSYTSSGVSTINSTAGFVMYQNQASQTSSGHLVLTGFGSNIWIESHCVGSTGGSSFYGGGTKTTSGTLDRVRITTVNGTDTFDAGSINIIYEG